MRISDWSSDVCSSDLSRAALRPRQFFRFRRHRVFRLDEDEVEVQRSHRLWVPLRDPCRYRRAPIAALSKILAGSKKIDTELLAPFRSPPGPDRRLRAPGQGIAWQRWKHPGRTAWDQERKTGV